jgi:hypothetical protein
MSVQQLVYECRQYRRPLARGGPDHHRGNLASMIGVAAGGGSMASIGWTQIKAYGCHALRMLEAIRYVWYIETSGSQSWSSSKKSLALGLLSA